MEPHIPGHDYLKAPAFSSFIEHRSGRKLVYDLGVRKDWHNFSPKTAEILQQPGWKVTVPHGVADYLQHNGVDVAAGAIEAVIWSHWHFDHVGDPSTFPKSTALVVGKGMKEAILPGYPTNPDGLLLDSDFAGRDHKIIDFDQESQQIGPFRARDYFGDGSFYLLDAPGHAVGHMCGLARTTSTQEGDSQDTFVFMGADTAHHGAQFRPTEYLPLPTNITPSPYPIRFPSACPGHLFETIHPDRKANAPYYHIGGAITMDKETAQETIGLMQQFDALDNVFVIIAHDGTLRDPEVGVKFWPSDSLRDWKEKDYRVKARWTFLKDLAGAMKAA